MAEYRDIMVLKNALGLKVGNLHKTYKRKLKPWKDALEEMAVAFHNAYRSHKDVLNKRKELKKARQDLCMAVIGLACGSALGWVGLSIKQSGRFSKLATEKDIKENFLGNLIDVMKVTADQTLKVMSPSITLPDFKCDPVNFKADLLKAFDNQVDMTKGVLLQKETSVLYSETLPKKFLSQAKGKMYGAEALVDAYVAQLQVHWCDSVRYFRKKPAFPSRANMARMIERGMWASWLNAYLKITREWVPKTPAPTLQSSMHTSHPIEDRLVELNVLKVDGNSDRKLIKAAKKKLNLKGGKWESSKPSVPNPGWWTSTQDMMPIKKWAQSYQPEKIGNWK